MPAQRSKDLPVSMAGESVSSAVEFSYELGPKVNSLGRWIPQSQRERNKTGIESGDVIGRTYHDGKRILEELARQVRFDRSYLDDVELQETSHGTRFREDAHDLRSVLSLKRVSVALPLYECGLTKVSLELNADKLYRAVRGDIPQLRGGLAVKF